MPIRNMLYDAMTLTEQVAATAKSHKAAHNHGNDNAEFLSGFHRDDKVLPVITLVVYWGADEWDAPVTLREMYPEGLDESILKFIKHSKDKTELTNLVNNNQEYKSLDRLAAQTISVCSGQDFNFPVGEERIDVCKAIDDMVTDARNEGIDVGRSQGRDEATHEGMRNVIATVKDLNLGKEVAMQQLAKRYSLSQEAALEFVDHNW
ncbi:hypothetical protein [Selenomonas ruminantium]|nr:hypothetical protein [Selenomonas ruminantium]